MVAAKTEKAAAAAPKGKQAKEKKDATPVKETKKKEEPKKEQEQKPSPKKREAKAVAKD